MGKSNSSIRAREVLDSRGNPTVEVIVNTQGSSGTAIVPSGASTGIYEALELRDKIKRYNQKGVLKAVGNVNKIINSKLKGMDVTDQFKIDQTMIELDKTENKSKLGANAILGVSLAVSRAASNSTNQPLYQYISKLFSSIYKSNKKLTIPIPFCNVINGGVHAGNDLKMQEFMIVPTGFRSYEKAVQAVVETYHLLKTVIEKRYGKNATNVGDEGGFAPPISTAKQALALITKAIQQAGYQGKIKIAMDPAASEFFNKGIYSLDKQYDSKMLTRVYSDLVRLFDIISIEDPFDQDDFDAYENIMLKTKVQIVGDDLLVTNPTRIAYAIQHKLCNALLLKVNQIGTLAESLHAAKLSMENGWKVMVSHRSGETEDSFIADLAVGIGSGQIKIGAPCRSDRTAKYNQLLRISEELGNKGVYARW